MSSPFGKIIEPSTGPYAMKMNILAVRLMFVDIDTDQLRKVSSQVKRVKR